MLKKLILLIFLIQSCYSSDIFYYKGDKKVDLIPLDRSSRSLSLNYGVDFYKTKHGRVLGVTDKLIVSVKNTSNLDDFLLDYNLILVKKLDKNLYLLQTNDKSETIKISNFLHENKNVIYAEPNFVKNIVSR